MDLLTAQPYTQVQSYLEASEPKSHHYYWKSEYVAALTDGFLSALRELAAECPIPPSNLFCSNRNIAPPAPDCRYEVR